MAHLFLLPILALVSLISASQAFSFNSAYIQNVKSGACVTIVKDANLYPLHASKCDCGLFQFWKMEDGEHVINEFALQGYMDQLYGTGTTVGNYGYTGSLWQKWSLNEGDDGVYTFVNQNSKKCLRQGQSGKIDHWDCDDDDQSQQWKIIKRPCGKLPTPPSDKFQLQNLATGKCAVIPDKNDAAYANVVIHKCSCDNDYQYWKSNQQTLVTQGWSKQCMSNWEDYGYQGITQYACDLLTHHIFILAPNGDGSFRLGTDLDGRCAYVDSESDSTQLGFEDCDYQDTQQKWRFYNECNPEPLPTPKPPPPPPTPVAPIPPSPQLPSVIPNNLVTYFKNGQMNWLNPDRYILLTGGRWDAVNYIWYTADGRQIRPSTADWATYFGDLQPSQMSMFFPNGGSWNDVFGWITPDFFQLWTGWQQGYNIAVL